jgi:hypothetical protein
VSVCVCVCVCVSVCACVQRAIICGAVSLFAGLPLTSHPMQVLIDTRALQKDISQLSDKLGRTFTVADELVFKV